MKFVPLKEIVTFRGGGTPSKKVADYWDGDIPWVTVKDFKGLEISSTQRYISSKGLKKSAANIIPKGHVIIPTRMALGKAAINKVDLAINQDLKGLIPKQKIDTKFLLYAVLGLASQIEKRGSGATVKGITIENLSTLKIPLPSIDDQIKTATLLNRVEALIATRKENLRLLDEFLKSTFLEMFGDPVRNEREWDIDDCHKVVVGIKSGTSYGGEDRPLLKHNEMGVLKISAVTKGIFNASEFKAVDCDKIKKQVVTVKKNDFLVSRANTFELVAACCVVDQSNDRLFLPDKLWKLSFDEKRVNPQFFNYLLKNNSFRNIVRKQASGGHESMLNISMAKFRQLRVIVPDKPSQDKFANIVDKIGSLRKRYQQSLTELENLYGALSQKAFKGELDLSNIPIEEDSERKE